jgi:hypothetical protein
MTNTSKRRAFIAYVAAMATLGSLMAIVALGGGTLSVKKSASDLYQAQMTVLKDR